MPRSQLENEHYWDADTVAACDDCHCGYVWVNPHNPRPRCLACDGLIRPLREITPVSVSRMTPIAAGGRGE